MQKDDLVLVYLLMSVDGNVSAEEDNQFDELLKQSGFSEAKNTVIGKAKDILSSVEAEMNDSQNWLEGLHKKYKSQLENDCSNNSGYLLNFVLGNRRSKAEYKELLWAMVNMAMIDNDFSENEKKFIGCCCKDWNVEDSLLEEMIEIAKTLYSLYSHLDLLKSINRSYGEIEPLVNELNANKAVLEENLKDLISA